jgi:hypothetical protein
MSISGLPPIPPAYDDPTGQDVQDLNKAIESLAVTMIADRSMDRVKEQWEEDRKKDPL